jgi:hypothetical protein
MEKVLGLYRDRYFDLNVRHFHEKLEAEHQVKLSYSWVKGMLQGAGLVARERKRGYIGSGVHVDRCLACCCISTAAGTAGCRMNTGTT